MPTPSTKGMIMIKITNAGATDYITILNETQGWTKRVQCSANSEVIYSPINDGYTLSNNDIIYVYANGRLRGNGSGKVSSSRVQISFTGTADTISQAVSL